jgi:hypothetical protein
MNSELLLSVLNTTEGPSWLLVGLVCVLAIPSAGVLTLRWRQEKKTTTKRQARRRAQRKPPSSQRKKGGHSRR